VFDTGKIQFVTNAPMHLLKVEYASAMDRGQRLSGLLSKWATVVKQGNIADEHLWLAAFAALRAIILFGLTHKHDGFAEEREWRIVYLREIDVAGVLSSQLGYSLGKQGVEPRLKFRLEVGSARDWPKQGLETLLDKIILGPSVSSYLAKQAVDRMLQTQGKAQFIGRVVASTIPLRPSGPAR
jgi:hypothetical protein